MPANVEALTPSAAAEKGWAAVYADLIKARLTLLVLLTTLVGFYIGCHGAFGKRRFSIESTARTRV